ncbi:MAG: hypothetical protein HY736_06505 [Verrucomicrobia bacterium]|nr:hypothetical protein [Verrucomicrobiota bacterium]
MAAYIAVLEAPWFAKTAAAASTASACACSRLMLGLLFVALATTYVVVSNANVSTARDHARTNVELTCLSIENPDRSRLLATTLPASAIPPIARAVAAADRDRHSHCERPTTEMLHVLDDRYVTLIKFQAMLAEKPVALGAAAGRAVAMERALVGFNAEPAAEGRPPPSAHARPRVSHQHHRERRRLDG